MKWIKGTERLPPEPGVYFVKSKAHGKIIINIEELDSAKIYFNNDDCEWLDEQGEGWMPMEQFADFMDTERNKGLDGKKKESLWNDMEIWGSREAFKKMLVKFKERHPPATKD